MALPFLAAPLLTPQGILISAATATLICKGGQYAYHGLSGMLKARKAEREYDDFKMRVDWDIDGKTSEGFRVVFHWFNISHSMTTTELLSYSHAEACKKLIVHFTLKVAPRRERGPEANEIAKAVSAAIYKAEQLV